MEDWEGVVNFYFALSRNYFIHKYLILISIFWDNTKFTEFEIIEELEFSMDYFSAPPAHTTMNKKILHIVSKNLITGSYWLRSTFSEIKGTYIFMINDYEFNFYFLTKQATPIYIYMPSLKMIPYWTYTNVCIGITFYIISNG